MPHTVHTNVMQNWALILIFQIAKGAGLMLCYIASVKCIMNSDSHNGYN